MPFMSKKKSKCRIKAIKILKQLLKYWNIFMFLLDLTEKSIPFRFNGENYWQLHIFS